MNIGNVGATGLRYNMHSAAIKKAESDKTFKIGSATREATANGDGKNIGVMTIGNQAYLAQYSENSTPAKPIVKVGDYEVSVNDVDPENATEIEMFALMSHLDKTGQSNNSGMSSFSKMRTYSQQAEYNGFCNGIADANEAWNRKRNWTEIIENARQTYSQSLIPEIYALTRKCDSLLDVMQKCIQEVTSKKPNTNTSKFDFNKFASNAPAEVKQAFVEAANEIGSNGTGMDANGKMRYISQILMKRIINAHNGVPNPDDIFGNTIESALQAAKELLYELENPLTPISERGEGVSKYIEEEKEFYKAFIEKLEALTASEQQAPAEAKDYRKQLEEKMKEILEKLQQKNPEKSFQIGGQTFTEKEWKRFLEKFDSLEEAIKELMKEEQEKKAAESQWQEEFQKQQNEMIKAKRAKLYKI